MGILKIIMRTLLILAAAGLVCAGIYLWVNSNGNSLGFGQEGRIEQGGGSFQPGDRPQFNNQRAFPNDGTRPERLGRGGREGGFAGGLGLQRGLIDLAGKLGLIALVTAGVTLLGWLIKRFQRKKLQTN
jgi:hypothetical protein